MPSRKLLVTIHLYLAAVFTPMILLMALTGTLYLFGIKGKTEYTVVQTLQIPKTQLNRAGDNLNGDISGVLQQAGIEFEFEYIKVKGNKFYTRPTSRDHYLLVQKGNRVEISKGTPDFLAAMVELHKGHGPVLFKWLEKIFGICLVLIALSGFLLGLLSPVFKTKTLALSGVGLVLVVVAAIL